MKMLCLIVCIGTFYGIIANFKCRHLKARNWMDFAVCRGQNCILFEEVNDFFEVGEFRCCCWNFHWDLQIGWELRCTLKHIAHSPSQNLSKSIKRFSKCIKRFSKWIKRFAKRLKWFSTRIFLEWWRPRMMEESNDEYFNDQIHKFESISSNECFRLVHYLRQQNRLPSNLLNGSFRGSVSHWNLRRIYGLKCCYRPQLNEYFSFFRRVNNKNKHAYAFCGGMNGDRECIAWY